MKNAVKYYSVGALLYCPANRAGIAESIINQKFGDKFSLALCLEDTIGDDCVEEAEEMMRGSLEKIYRSSQKKVFYLPQVFIRVREAEQIVRLMKMLGKVSEIINGFILPKFSLDNADAYIQAVRRVNENVKSPVYMMPIFESPSLINLRDRYDILYKLKEKLDQAEELVLNIRVGGNDLCNVFGFRRHSNESIHKIHPIAGILSDIITVYGRDYVVSGPVWEYYDGPGWENGLRQELEDDRLCGFVGKTVIHPKQIELVNEAYQVSREDFDDARQILGWDADSRFLVAGSSASERMNEYKVHTNWAARTMMMAEAFGEKGGL